jgi:hypothetical protein
MASSTPGGSSRASHPASVVRRLRRAGASITYAGDTAPGQAFGNNLNLPATAKLRIDRTEHHTDIHRFILSCPPACAGLAGETSR